MFVSEEDHRLVIRRRGRWRLGMRLELGVSVSEEDRKLVNLLLASNLSLIHI